MEDLLSYEGYHLVFEDRFDKTELDRSHWNVERHEPGWVNQELQRYVDCRDNICLRNGKLLIRPIKAVQEDGSISYTSDRITTQYKRDFTCGLFEARLRVPKGKDFLPAFWLMTTDEDRHGQWPECGEIDIMEIIGEKTKTNHGTIHYGLPHEERQGTVTLEKGDFAEEFHNFALLWEPELLRWYVDGRSFYEVRRWFSVGPDGVKKPYPAPLTTICTFVAAIPIYGHSADNLRDHRNVISMLHRTRITQHGVLVKPAMSFDEKGHRENHKIYYVLGSTGNGVCPESFYPTVEGFLGEGGTFLHPRAVYEGAEGVPAGTEVDGREAMGGIRFPAMTLEAGQNAVYIVLMGIAEDAEEMDGTNATIIGDGVGNFIADRNSIARVWMDHALWPLMTTMLYIDQTGDLDILLESVPYFKDPQAMRGTQIDPLWNEVYGNRQRTQAEAVYTGSILEHLLIQHLAAFYEVGKHNIFRLRGADWNDALDMAVENGESVAFTCAYAGNLLDLAGLLRRLAGEQDRVELLAELQPLLESGPEVYGDISHKKALLAENLEGKAHWLMEHIRRQEWIKDGKDGWFNSYHDNYCRPLEGITEQGVRMMLTGQVFAIMSGTATEEQVGAIIQSADRYLYKKEAGGYRLNTDFHELKLDMGRMFGFAYGEKENGAVFSYCGDKAEFLGPYRGYSNPVGVETGDLGGGLNYNGNSCGPCSTTCAGTVTDLSGALPRPAR